MLTHKTLHLRLPNIPLYDHDFCLETFAGEHVLPFADKLHWLWITRYGGPGAREIRLRFAIENFADVEAAYIALTQTFTHGVDGCGDWDHVQGLGNSRFLGGDAREQDPTKRADLVYEFLNASARLLLACIVREANGTWRHEIEQASGLNRETSLETFHHLFCNMTGVPTWAAALQMPNQLGNLSIVSDLQSRGVAAAVPNVQVQLLRIVH